MDSLQGHLLIASPQLLDPNFVKTVVLLIRHTEEGAFGVVINRPTSKTVGELWKDVSEAECDSIEPVYLGGPVSGPLIALHSSESLAEITVLPEVFVAATKEHLDELVRGEGHSFKVLVGNAGWAPGQLEGELEAGGWLTLPATAEYVFYDGEDLWDRACKQSGRSVLESMLDIKHVPDDPSVN
jgi:putative transcriptional regulator